MPAVLGIVRVDIIQALYKVANGEDIKAAPAPGMFDLKVRCSRSHDDASCLVITDTPGKLQGKAKKNAWQKVVDEGITPEQAQEKYVALVERMKTTYGYDANKDPEAVGS